MMLFSLWLPKKDSNPHKQSQSLSCYLYTIRQCRLLTGNIIAQDGAVVKRKFYIF